MPQEPYKNDNRKLPKFSSRPTDGGGGGENGQRKGPRFSIYWVYAIIFAVLIGFQLFGPFAPNNVQINQNDFQQMMRDNDVAKYTVVYNRNIVRVYLKREALPKYEQKFDKKFNPNDDGPQAFFKIVSGDSFQDDMRAFYKDNPAIHNVGTVESETNWFSPILQTVLPILIFIGLWILLMRKMGGGAGGGG